MKKVEKISPKTIERLSLYRRVLKNHQALTHNEYIFSHDLAYLAETTSPQVRRDLMTLKLSGNPNRGYHIPALVDEISSFLKIKSDLRLCLVGGGNLGSAILSYFAKKSEGLTIVALFDVDPKKIGQKIADTPCYSMTELEKRIMDEKIKMAILAVPHHAAQETTDRLIAVGVECFVNFTHAPLHVPENVHVENVDITASIEKAGYFVKR